MTKIAINGLGRIGRAVFQIALDTPELDVAAINDLVPTDNLAYLLRHDTVYGNSPHNIDSTPDSLVVDGQQYPVYSEKDPAQLPWQDLDIDVVLECTGIFTKRDQLEKHIQAGAKRVILSAPPKSEGIPTIVHGVNQPADDDTIFSCASCTTNCITPVVEVLGRRVGVKKAILNTVHAYTSTQGIVDSPSKKMRRGRAAAANLVPTSTGAAKATTAVLTDYAGKFDGIAVRAPVPVGSVSDITFVTDRPTSVEEINSIFKEEAGGDQYREILSTSDDELVSSDIVRNPAASIVDLTMTQVVDGDLVKVMSWYDNEWGYANQMVRETIRLSRQIPQLAS